MTKLAQSPAFVATLGLVFGLAAGLGWFWRVGDLLVTHALTTRVSAAKQQKAQGWDFWTIEIDNLASELKGEKERLRKQTEQLDLRAARLDAEQQELDKVRGELERMRKEISQRVIEIGTDEAKNLKTLATTYSNLSPRAAVAIIKELDDNTAVKILSLMKPDTVSPIFEEMSRTAAVDGTLARRVAVLSEKLRLMKSNKPATS
ncbi:MotE family protein [Oleiharenicola sp. Vm1]|uniref:MotE family protein n=1 Tax=Oleiharenicola sp. Vm1 TaxID=3398393 RepID=UPI0039F57177